MKSNLKKISAILLTTLAILVFALVLDHAVFYMPEALGEAIVPQQQNSAALYPKQLRVPSIGVNAKVQYVGVTAKGKMATPNNFTDVGWYKYGTLPGDTGSAIIAGHVDNGLAFPGVFKNLDNVKMGDDVYVDMENGTTIHFKVTQLDVYDYNAPTEDIFNQKDGKYIKLITCTGVWVSAYGTHDERLIVTAKEVS